MHHKKHNHHNFVVNESLMNVIPLIHEEKEIFEDKGSLAPVDNEIE